VPESIDWATAVALFGAALPMLVAYYSVAWLLSRLRNPG
jgi:hypothetical protein